MDLFDADRTTRPIPMDGGTVTYAAAARLPVSADEAMRRLSEEIPWGVRSGHWGAEPRMTSWHADPGVTYRYSGITMMPKPFTPLLHDIRLMVEDATGAMYNSVLLNLYRSGEDSMGFHSDDEPELGSCPTIASLSLGAERTFELRRKDGTGDRIRIPLAHGSLLVMSGHTQENWQHGIRKVRTPTGPRINLTFRMTGPR